LKVKRKAGSETTACYQRAADCEKRARQVVFYSSQAELLEIASRWKHLAKSYELVEGLEQVLVQVAKQLPKNEKQPLKNKPANDN
jgi:hypothetical protein